MTARTQQTCAPKEIALALALLVLAAASGDLGHALAGGTWHGFETTIAAATGGPADPNGTDPISSHLATDCPLCRVGRGADTALVAQSTFCAAIDATTCAVCLPESRVPDSPIRRAHAARAPPENLST